MTDRRKKTYALAHRLLSAAGFSDLDPTATANLIEQFLEENELKWCPKCASWNKLLMVCKCKELN